MSADSLSMGFDNQSKVDTLQYTFALIAEQMYGPHPSRSALDGNIQQYAGPTYCPMYPDIESKGNCYHYVWGECTEWGYVNPHGRKSSQC